MSSKKRAISREDTLEKLRKLMQYIRAQAWDEALDYSKKVTSYYDVDSNNLRYFMLMDASCYRRKGDHNKARSIYVKLYELITTHDEIFADVEEGLAESYIVTGDFELAHERALLAYNAHATQLDPTSDLGFRVRNQLAHSTSYININDSLLMYEAIFSDVDRKGKNEVATSAIANAYFQYANILFRDGQFENSIIALRKSQELALKSSALKTIADCKRKLPLVYLLAGKTSYALDGMLDMDYAQEVYSVIGDRAKAYSYTERAELLKALGRYENARDEYKSSLWGARDINDLIRIAHSNLGLYDLDRVEGFTPKSKYFEEAYFIYDKYGFDWGVVNSLIRKALASTTLAERDKILSQASDAIEKSTQADFKYEKSLIEKYKKLPLEDSQKEKPLLNWS